MHAQKWSQWAGFDPSLYGWQDGAVPMEEVDALHRALQRLRTFLLWDRGPRRSRRFRGSEGIIGCCQYKSEERICVLGSWSCDVRLSQGESAIFMGRSVGVVSGALGRIGVGDVKSRNGKDAVHKEAVGEGKVRDCCRPELFRGRSSSDSCGGRGSKVMEELKVRHVDLKRVGRRRRVVRCGILRRRSSQIWRTS